MLKESAGRRGARQHSPVHFLRTCGQDDCPTPPATYTARQSTSLVITAIEVSTPLTAYTLTRSTGDAVRHPHPTTSPKPNSLPRGACWLSALCTR